MKPIAAISREEINVKVFNPVYNQITKCDNDIYSKITDNVWHNLFNQFTSLHGTIIIQIYDNL